MRQETTNTFDKGLNKDLNPIVTPNDVLTDCLNGTFITFNGDELVLQNDAGNTKIPTKWDKKMLLDYSKGSSYNKNVIVKLEDGILYRSLIDSNTKPIFNEDDSLNKIYWELFDPSVKLSDGFYPIGIKEYGGVLYIVSANKETNKVEFGSYPSPIYAKHDLYNAEEVIKIINPKEDLYKARVLNDVFFKSGGYILFNSVGDIDVSNLSTPTETKMYKVRLLHKLNNGVFDLTTDVWEKFEDYKTKENSLKVDHWIISGATTAHKEMPFKYFCPNQFRGKLSVVIELDEPKDFSFVKLPKISLGPNDYKLNFEVDYESSENIPIEGFKGIITYENGDIKEISGDKEEVDISLSKDRKSISYKIYPNTPYEWEVFPEEFKDKFALKGSLLLEERFHSLYYELDMGDCDSSNSFRTYKMLILSNANGPLGLDMENVREGEKLTVFTLDGFDMPNKEDYNILGKFYISANNAVLIESSLNTQNLNIIREQEEGDVLVDLIERKVNSTQVVVEDSSCKYFTILVQTNYSFELNSSGLVVNDELAFYQTSQNPMDWYPTDNPVKAPYRAINNRTFEVEIDVTKNLRVDRKLLDNAFGQARFTVITKDQFRADELFKIGFITYVNDVYTDVTPTTVQYFESDTFNGINERLLELAIPQIEYVYTGTDEGVTTGEAIIKRKPDNKNSILFPIYKPKDPNNIEFIGSPVTRSDNYIGLSEDTYIKYGNETNGYIIFPKKNSFRIHESPIFK